MADEFNWGEQEDATEFDWEAQESGSKPLEELIKEPPKEGSILGRTAKGAGSMALSNLAGVSEGSTFGFGGELAGVSAAQRAAIPGYRQAEDWLGRQYADKVLDIEGADKLPGDKTGYLQGILDAYRGTKGQSDSFNRSRKEKDPWAYGLGELTGGAATSIAGGRLLKPLGTFGQKAISKVPGIGKSKVLQGFGAGLAEGVPMGSLYGLGSSEADLTKGEFSEAIVDTLEGGLWGGIFGGPIGAATAAPGAIAAKYGKSKATQDQIRKILEGAEVMERQGGAPEAKILRELSEEAGTPQGLAKRQTAVQSGGARQEMQKKFYRDTENMFEGLKKKKKGFDTKQRMNEAKKNLEDVPFQETKEAAEQTIYDVKNRLNEISPKGYTSNMVDDGLITQDMLSRDLRLRDMYKQGDLGHARTFIDDLADKIDNATSTYEIYDELYKSKQIFDDLSDFSTVGKDRIEKITEKEVRLARTKLNSLLKNEEVFHQQATRHAEIDKAYTKYLTAIDNMKTKLLGARKTEIGREQFISPGRLQTYAVQLDELRGMDRAQLFDDFLSASKDFSDVIDQGPAGPVDKFSRTLKNYNDIKNSFDHDQKLTNQFSKLTWKEWQEAVGNKGGFLKKLFQEAPIPGTSAVAKALPGQERSGGGKQLIRELIEKETMGGAITGTNIEKVLKYSPESLGKFGTTLSEALRRGGTNALNATSHVLMQKDPEYRKKIRELNGQEEPN